jgi:predicted enzyme related to lactoylglutathione lyase
MHFWLSWMWIIKEFKALLKAGLVTIAAIDFQKLVTFYHQFLDVEPRVWQPNHYAEFELPGIRLGIFQPSLAHQAEFANATGNRISLCLEVDNLEATIAHVASLGFPPPGTILTPTHGREIYAYDPEGNRLILYQPRQ